MAISYGDCAALGSLVYGATVLRGGMGAATAPKDLPSGTYAFRATALGSKGGVIAQTCSEIDLPSARGVQLLLGSEDSCGTPPMTADGSTPPAPQLQDGSLPPDGGGPASWVEKTLPYASGAAASAVLSDGLHYLGGSQNYTAAVRYSDHYVYDAATGLWSDAPANIPDTDTWGARACVYQDRLYLLGGYPGANGFRVYDPDANAWSPLPTPPIPLSWGFASEIVDGVLYAFGGAAGSATDAAGCAYDFAAGKWTSVAAIPNNQGRGSLSSAAVGSRIYVLNGNSSVTTTILQIYDTTSDQWSRGADLAGHQFEAASAAVDGAKIYFFGGAADQDIVDTSTTPAAVSSAVNIFDTATGAWSQGTPMLTPNMWSTAKLYAGRFHVLGGLDPESKQIDVHALGK